MLSLSLNRTVAAVSHFSHVCTIDHSDEGGHHSIFTLGSEVEILFGWFLVVIFYFSVCYQLDDNPITLMTLFLVVVAISLFFEKTTQYLENMVP